MISDIGATSKGRRREWAGRDVLLAYTHWTLSGKEVEWVQGWLKNGNRLLQDNSCDVIINQSLFHTYLKLLGFRWSMMKITLWL